MRDIDQKGVGVVMDSHYRIQQKIHLPRDFQSFNMHEFNVIEDGRSALAATSLPVWDSIESLHDERRVTAWISNAGFIETDLQTNEVLFDWRSLGHVDVIASKQKLLNGDGRTPKNAWDWL